MENKRSYLSNLDLLRFLAALYVVSTHYGFIGPQWGMTHYASPTGFISEVFRLGYVGVPIFFVLSGFLIAHVTQKTDAVRFGVNRILRLMPGFWASMTLSFVILMVLGSAHEMSLMTWVANLLLLPQAFGQPFVDGVYWTLVYEFVFYAWVGVFIFLGVFHRHIFLIGAVWLAVASANVFLLDSAILDRLLITKFAGAFIVGMAFWHIYAKGWSYAVVVLIALATLHLAFGLKIMSAQTFLPNPPQALSIPVSILVSIAIIGVVALAIFGPQIKGKGQWLTTLGAISYPLYLIHQEIGYAVFRNLAFLKMPLITALTMVFVSIYLAYIIHKFAETPLRKFLQLRITPLANIVAERVEAAKRNVGKRLKTPPVQAAE